VTFLQTCWPSLVTAPSDGITVRRRLQLAGARITGTLDLHSATLARSLVLRQCRIIEPVVLHDADAQALEFPGSHVQGIDATGCRCRGDLNLSDGFTAEGEVSLLGAHIGGIIDCTDGTFRNPDGIALNADGLTVDQSMFCSGAFTAEGQVVLLWADIGGLFDCNGGTFRNLGGVALNADGLTVGQTWSAAARSSPRGRSGSSAPTSAGSLPPTAARSTTPAEPRFLWNEWRSAATC
jgi:hypothetical protein